MALEGEADVFLHGHGIEQGCHLETHADLLACFEELLAFQLLDDLALDGDVARIGGQQAHDGPEQDRLARTRASHHGEAFPFLHGKIHIGEHHLRSEGLGEVHDIDDGFQGGLRQATVSSGKSRRSGSTGSWSPRCWWARCPPPRRLRGSGSLASNPRAR